jgi:predicted NBD/HSP70 family sugar kinase
VTVTETAARGAGNDSVRRENLATVLRLVHLANGRSRSELTALTGLNRSTIAALVAELVTRKLVIEVDPRTPTRAGRPSPVVSPSNHIIALAVNPEIDAVVVAAVGLGARVVAKTRIPASADISAAEAVALTVEAINDIRDDLIGHTVVGIGVAVPGLVRADDGLIRLAPHFGWVDEPFSAMLSTATGLPVSASNDATLGVLAEGRFGAGRGISDLVYLNGGASGIGGGIVTGGVPLTGAAGYAGELGHTLVNSSGVLCHCGATGCLETEVRRSALLESVGLEDVVSDRLEEALHASTDPVVAAEIERQLGYLGVTLRNAINILNPQRIVLGGFLAALYGVAPHVLDALVADQPLSTNSESVQIVRAELGSNILMVGAAELAFASILADPASFAE